MEVFHFAGCFHQGECFEGGHLIDADTCLRCFSDGKTAHVEQGNVDEIITR